MTQPANAAPTHEPGLPPPENHQFFPALDGLRALAVLAVFWQHYLAFRHPATNWGWAGVDIFFVLSGFLITGILFDSLGKPHRVRNFYARRTLRIFPLFYGVLLLALLTTPIFHWAWNRAWILWALYLGNYVRFALFHSPLFTAGQPMGVIEALRAAPITPSSPTLLLGHFWSLCVEEQFYLVWPAVVFVLRRRVLLRNLCLLSLPLCLALRVVCVRVLPQRALDLEVLYRATPLRIDALLLGGALALALRGPERHTLFRLARPALLLALAAALLWSIVFYSQTGQLYSPFAGAPILTTIGFTLIDLFAAILILNLLHLDNPIAHLCNLAPLRALGRVSYGFYVFHDIFHIAILRLLTRHLGGPNAPHLFALTALAAFLLTLLLSNLSYRFYEKPILRLKSRFAN